MINLAQACQCADVLGCTVDEIAGRVPASSSAPSDPYERELMDCYRGSDVMRKSVILENARAMRERSGEDAKRSSAPAQEVSA